jgi:hypothetical protein
MSKKNDDDGLKSSFDLAMERLGGGDEATLTEDQKAEIASIDERMRASIAESEIMMDQKILAANQSGDAGKAAELEMQKVMVIQKARENAEDKKRQVREA